MPSAKERYLVVAGPTGSGKSGLSSLVLAEAFHGDIINCDSVQVYRGFNIGAAKATAADIARVPHHLLDRVAAHEDFDAAMFAKEAKEKKAEILARGRLASRRRWHRTLPAGFARAGGGMRVYHKMQLCA